MPQSLHQPVLVEAVIGMLNVSPAGVYLDATLGGGGYSLAALEAGAGRVIGLDWDGAALERTSARLAGFGERFTPARSGFQRADEVLAQLGVAGVDGVMVDLGLSSDQLADESRGFSFSAEGPLDMRMDTRQGKTAAELVNGLPEAELRTILFRLGEEKQAGRIARAIVAARGEEPFSRADKLAGLVARAKGPSPDRKPWRVHPATKTFQALRMAVNHEIENLESLLGFLPGLLKSGGRAAIVSFHSLEDRLVKTAFRDGAKGCKCPPRLPCVCGLKPVYRNLTSRPVLPDQTEVTANPRSRSAKLRAVERI